MPVVVESNRSISMPVNAGSNNSRTSEISVDVFGYDGRIAESRFGIEPVLLIAANRRFHFLKGITNTPFGNEAVNVRIPCKVMSKGMQGANEAGSETFRFIFVLEHFEDSLFYNRKNNLKKMCLNVMLIHKH